MPLCVRYTYLSAPITRPAALTPGTVVSPLTVLCNSRDYDWLEHQYNKLLNKIKLILFFLQRKIRTFLERGEGCWLAIKDLINNLLLRCHRCRRWRWRRWWNGGGGGDPLLPGRLTRVIVAVDTQRGVIVLPHTGPAYTRTYMPCHKKCNTNLYWHAYIMYWYYLYTLIEKIWRKIQQWIFNSKTG